MSRTRGDTLRLSVHRKKGRLIAALSLAVGVTIGAPSFAAKDRIARWNGGELSLDRFREIYDPHGLALASGGERLRLAAAKAVYLEIELARAGKLELEPDAAGRAEIERLRQNALVTAWLQRRDAASPAPAPTSDELRALWQREHATILPATVQASFDVFFVRCPLSAVQRPKCDERLERLVARVAAGEPFEQVARDEASRSGSANGSFEDQDPQILIDDLAHAVKHAPIATFTAAIPAPAGLYSLRVRKRAPVPVPAFEAVEPFVRKFAASQRIDTLAAKLPAPASGPDEPRRRIAAAAEREGLDGDPLVKDRVESLRRWVLADLAFDVDPQQAMSEREITAAIEVQPRRWRRVEVGALVVDARADRHAALNAAARIADELGTKRQLDASFERADDRGPTIEWRSLGILDEMAIDELDQGLATKLGNLDVGSSLGPVPVSSLDLHRPKPVPGLAMRKPGSSYEALVFLTVLRELPPDRAKVDLKLRHELRERMTANSDAFLANFGARWGVEFFIPE